MNEIQALILGLIQGLTEYLPVSSSGHLTIASEFFGLEGDQNLTFTVAVHVATVLSTLVILWKEIVWLFRGLFRCERTEQGRWQLNAEQRYALAILVSMIPVGIVGLFFKDYVEEIFGSGLLIVGWCLIVTALLLIFSQYSRPRQKEEISRLDAFIIGIAQAVAVLPGLSRSGSTIATGLLLGNKKERLAQFSFLMVIPPILGEALLDILKAAKHGSETVTAGIGVVPLVVGFAAAFFSGCMACKWMIGMVKRSKLIYFGIYCAVVGTLLVGFSLFAR